MDAENRDLQQLLWHRHRLVQMRTRIMNRLLVVALNEGVRRKNALWRPAGVYDGGIIARRCKQRFERNYSMLYWMWIPRLDISSRNRSAGMSRSCSMPPRLVMAPEAIICTTIEAGNAVVRIMALISVLGS